MSLTHYFPGALATAEIIADATGIIVQSPVTVLGPDGTGEPVTNLTDGILFNGEKLFGEDYETFHLLGTDRRHEETSWYCKTAGHPYDEVVTACLVSLFVRTGVPVRSDASWEDWALGLSLFERAVRPLTADERLALEMSLSGMMPELPQALTSAADAPPAHKEV